MPDYSRLHDFVSHRVVLEYDTGARIVGYLANCRPGQGTVHLARLEHVRFEDPEGNLLEEHESVTLCPNVLTGFRLQEGPSGREVTGAR